jgi:NADP-dependent 3-hydroxy acid dehydrogenase YdfG
MGVLGLTRCLALDGRKNDIACGEIDIGNAATDMTSRMTGGVKQADGSLKPEARIDVSEVARTVAHMASLPLDANILYLTIMPQKMPLVGRG